MNYLALLAILLGFQFTEEATWQFSPSNLEVFAEGVHLDRLGEKEYQLRFEGRGKELMEKVEIQIQFSLRQCKEQAIDIEGWYEPIMERTQSIWECTAKGLLINRGKYYVFVPNKLCRAIPSELIPGGDQFIPGGDMFIPGGDQFSGESEEIRLDDCHFLHLSFRTEQEIQPVLLSLQVR